MKRILLLLLLSNSTLVDAQRVNLYYAPKTIQYGFGVSFEMKDHQFEVLIPLSENNSLNIPVDAGIGLSENDRNKAFSCYNDYHLSPSILYHYTPFRKFPTVTIGVGPNLNISWIRNFYPKTSLGYGWFWWGIKSNYESELIKVYKPGITAMIKARYKFIGLYAMSNIAYNNSFASIGAYLSINTKRKK